MVLLTVLTAVTLHPYDWPLSRTTTDTLPPSLSIHPSDVLKGGDYLPLLYLASSNDFPSHLEQKSNSLPGLQGPKQSSLVYLADVFLFLH